MREKILFHLKAAFLILISVLFLFFYTSLVQAENTEILYTEIEDEPIILEEEEEEVEKPEDKTKTDSQKTEDKKKNDSQKSSRKDGSKTEIKDKEKKSKKNGWFEHKIGSKTYYKYKKDGSDQYAIGKTKIGNHYYYFDKNARLLTNQWIKEKNIKTYYADKNGILAKDWKKISNYYYYFDAKNKLAQDLIKELGDDWYKKQTIHIKVNKYHNCVTIYAKSDEKKFNIPVKSFPCTSGYATKLLTTELKKANTYRWHQLMGPTYGQFCTRIHKGMLFHSVIYRRPNKYSLISRQYNKLGITASHGCVRLAVVDAKQIYDDVNRLGRVGLTIYSDAKSVGPLDKPNYPKVSWKQNFDPTDPTIK